MRPGGNPFMNRALALAEAAGAAGEVPVAALVVDPADRLILAETANRMEIDADPTAHAELLAIRAATRRRRSAMQPDRRGRYLDGCDLYVTLEPCPMCAQAIAFARIRRVYFAAWDPKGGGVDHGPKVYRQPGCTHRPDVYGGIGERAAAALLREFFRQRR